MSGGLDRVPSNTEQVLEKLRDWASRGDGFGSYKDRTDEENNGYSQAVDEVAVILGLMTARGPTWRR